jgi:hypothetical protein
MFRVSLRPWLDVTLRHVPFSETFVRFTRSCAAKLAKATSLPLGCALVLSRNAPAPEHEVRLALRVGSEKVDVVCANVDPFAGIREAFEVASRALGAVTDLERNPIWLSPIGNGTPRS